MTIKRNVDFILRAKGMTKRQLAEKMRISPQSLSNSLASPSISMKTAQKIAKALDVKISDIVTPPTIRKLKERQDEPDFKNVENPTTTTIKCPCCGALLHITAEDKHIPQT